MPEELQDTEENSMLGATGIDFFKIKYKQGKCPSKEIKVLKK